MEGLGQGPPRPHVPEPASCETAGESLHLPEPFPHPQDCPEVTALCSQQGVQVASGLGGLSTILRASRILPITWPRPVQRGEGPAQEQCPAQSSASPQREGTSQAQGETGGHHWGEVTQLSQTSQACSGGLCRRARRRECQASDPKKLLQRYRGAIQSVVAF
jgi:hypothetical protein